MSIDVTSLPNPKAPTNTSRPNSQTMPSIPDPKDHAKKLRQFQQDQKKVHQIKDDINKSIKEINKTVENALGKNAKLICLLRLDMVADKLDNINPRIAAMVDTIANSLEIADWEE